MHIFREARAKNNGLRLGCTKTPDDCLFCIFGLSHYDGMMIRSEQRLSTEYNAGFSQVENDIRKKAHAATLIRYIKETVIRPFRTTGTSLEGPLAAQNYAVPGNRQIDPAEDALAHRNVFRL